MGAITGGFAFRATGAMSFKPELTRFGLLRLRAQLLKHGWWKTFLGYLKDPPVGRGARRRTVWLRRICRSTEN